MKKQKILHVDGNNFFASCEILMNPNLRNKPVCVLSNNDGCVIARSYEAKKCGIPMGIPLFLAKNQFKDIIYLSANFTLYHDISERLTEYLKKYSDKIDIYSIDEAFLDVTNVPNLFNLSDYDFCKKVKADIEKDIGISVSVGMASSKTLAKLATHKAKFSTGSYVIEDDLIKKELENIKTEEIWGIGKNIARTLKRYGIFYADEILLRDDEFYKRILGKKGLELKYELAGINILKISGIREEPKSIQKTRAFPNFSSDRNYIKTEINIHIKNTCKKLRSKNLMTSTIGIMLRTKDFHVFYTEKKLDTPTNSELILTQYAKELFQTIFKENIIYRSSGVIVSQLKNTQKSQLCLFNDEKDLKSQKISLLMDKIDNKFGAGNLNLGSIGIKKIINEHKRERKFQQF